MGKKKWEEPKINVEKFSSNEYISACNTYVCNAPSGVLYEESNGSEGLQRIWSIVGTDTLYAYFTAETNYGGTEETRTTVSKDSVVAKDGYILTDAITGAYQEVYMWEYNGETHVTLKSSANKS